MENPNILYSIQNQGELAKIYKQQRKEYKYEKQKAEKIRWKSRQTKEIKST
jgi:hypothetical protein